MLSISYLFELSTLKNIPLKIYLHKHILPIYKTFDNAHNQKHAIDVANFSVKLANKLNVDKDIAYCVGLLHDVGLKNNREFHHIESGKYIKDSNFLNLIFNKDQIKLIKEAVEDHRASNNKIPRNIYGKIVADSDRSDFVKLEDWFLRSWNYRINKQKDLSDDELFEELWERIQVSFSSNKGTVKFLLKETKDLLQKDLNRTKQYAKNKNKLYKKYLELRKSGFLKRTYKYSK
jgi:uncharacterized protein